MKFFKNILKTFSDLKNYNFQKFKSDLSAGLVTGIVAIPLSLALAIATGEAAGVEIPPIVGLYTAAIAGITAAIFAGSSFNVSGPAAAMVPILGSVIKENGLDALPLIGLIAGVILIIFGIFKVGTFIKYVPLSVTLGFTAGIAITLFFGQLNSFLGLTGIHNHEHFHEKVVETFKHLDTVNFTALAIGLLSLAILILLPKIKLLSKIPPSLISVILTTSIVYFGAKTFSSLDGVTTIADKYGEIKLGFPPVRSIEFTNILDYIAPALKIAFLISIESLLCAVVADKMTKSRHNSNQELIAQGIANIAVPFLSGITATAVIARTGTSIKSGAKSRIAALLHGLLVLTFLMVLAPVGSKIPLTVLSSILFMTAWKISEQKEIRHFMKIAPKSDLGILFLTMFLTVFLDLTIAVGVGMFLAILFIFKRLSTIHITEYKEDDDFISERLKKVLGKHKDLQFLNLEGNLSMGAAGTLSHKIKINPETKKVIIRLREVHHIDLSGLEALKDLIADLKASGVKVYLSSVNKRVLYKILRFHLDSEIEEIFENSNVLVKAF